MGFITNNPLSRLQNLLRFGGSILVGNCGWIDIPKSSEITHLVINNLSALGAHRVEHYVELANKLINQSNSPVSHVQSWQLCHEPRVLVNILQLGWFPFWVGDHCCHGVLLPRLMKVKEFSLHHSKKSGLGATTVVLRIKKFLSCVGPRLVRHGSPITRLIYMAYMSLRQFVQENNSNCVVSCSFNIIVFYSLLLYKSSRKTHHSVNATAACGTGLAHAYHQELFLWPWIVAPESIYPWNRDEQGINGWATDPLFGLTTNVYLK